MQRRLLIRIIVFIIATVLLSLPVFSLTGQLSEIENKKRNPTILLLDNIATVLEVSLIELLTDNSK